MSLSPVGLNVVVDEVGKERLQLAKPSLTPQLVTVKPTAVDRALQLVTNGGREKQRRQRDAAAQAVVVMAVKMYEDSTVSNGSCQMSPPQMLYTKPGRDQVGFQVTAPRVRYFITLQVNLDTLISTAHMLDISGVSVRVSK